MPDITRILRNRYSPAQKTLDEQQIKQTILHSNSEFRVQAISYFVDACSDDESVMPFVIKTRSRSFHSECTHHMQKTPGFEMNPGVSFADFGHTDQRRAVA